MVSPDTGNAEGTLAAVMGVTTLDFAGLDELVGYRMRRAQGAVHRDYLATMGKLKLTQKQTAVLWLVQANPGVAQGTIGGLLGMDRATMMVLVDRLEARGLLRRSRSQTDRRRRELHATAAGVRLLDRARERIFEHELRIKSQFSEEELAAFMRMLGQLQRLESGADT